MRPRNMRAMMVLGVTGVCVAATAPSVAQTPARADAGVTADAKPAPPPVREEAKKRHNEALASFRAGEFQEAYSGFIEAWDLQGLPRVPRIAGNLGRAELKIGKNRDAAEHLAYFLREEKDLSEEDRREFARQLADAKAKVGTLRVEVLQAGADIFVDGQRIGASPMETELYVEPGRRKVEARLGKLRASEELDVRAGATELAQLELALPKQPPLLPSSASPGSPTGAPPARSRTPGFVLGGVGLIGLGAGVGVLVLHVDRRGQAAALHGEIQGDGGHCRRGPTAHASCAALEGAARDADLFLGAGTPLLVGGAVFAAAGATYLLWAAQADKSGKNRQLTVTSLAGGAAFSLSGEL